MSNWQSMLTAPKTGERIMLFSIDTMTTEDVGIGRWGEFNDIENEWCWCMDDGEGWSEPDGWMSVPNPTKQKLE